jgi:1-acyl-sn-glycerol-3-phosphate acyltransferase
MRVVFAPDDTTVQRTHWRTYMVLAQTFLASVRVVARASVGGLDQARVDHRIHRWCHQVFGGSKTTVTVSGDEQLDRSQAYVLLSNHVSLLDVPSVCITFPGRVRFVAKVELRKVPMFGEAMHKAGVVFVDRANRAAAIEALRSAEALFDQGTSVWVAAEGSRSRDGRLHDFKKGGFHVALDHGLPIVPTWIQGTLDVLPPDQFESVSGQTVHVAYGEPIPTAGLGKADLPALMARVRASMLELARASGAAPDIDAAAPTA